MYILILLGKIQSYNFIQLFSFIKLINYTIIFKLLIRGIEWISQRYIISWSFYSYTLNTKSQVILTDIHCGQSSPLRINKVDEPHVLFVKVSPLK